MVEEFAVSDMSWVRIEPAAAFQQDVDILGLVTLEDQAQFADVTREWQIPWLCELVASAIRLK